MPDMVDNKETYTMKVLLFSQSTPDNDYSCKLPDVWAHGSTLDDLIPTLSDEIAQTIALHPDATFHVWGADKETLVAAETSVAEILDAVHNGATDISIDYPVAGNCAAFTDSFTIRDIPESPRHHLVKSGKTQAGTLDTPVVVASGSEEYCLRAMDRVKEDSCEHFDGGNGHWEYLGSEGEFVQYDIVAE